MRTICGLILRVLIITFIAGMIAEGESRVSIAIRPSVVMSGGAFWLTCTVPRNPHNRTVEWGVANFREGSQRDMEGEAAPVTYKVLIEHVPCDAGPAYCAVRTDDARWARAEVGFEVGGCN